MTDIERGWRDNFLSDPEPEIVKDSMNLYVVDYWEAFPSSEYGGVLNVIASSEEDAVKIIATKPFIYYDGGDIPGITKAVSKAKVLPLRGSPKPEVVTAFVT
jgi:hypothetical protein